MCNMIARVGVRSPRSDTGGSQSAEGRHEALRGVGLLQQLVWNFVCVYIYKLIYMKRQTIGKRETGALTVQCPHSIYVCGFMTLAPFDAAALADRRAGSTVSSR